MKRSFYRYYGKRCLDLILVVPAIVLASPVLLICALLVRIKLGPPVLFCQQRPGLHGHPFTLFKFRTMLDKRDAQGNLLPDADRLTRFGLFLRGASLDELPELFNVLKGEMSLVGPRPLLMQYLARYTPEQMRRHEVRQGLTGWAQINGRQDLKLSQRIELDVWYLENQSLLLDLKILLRTAIVVFHGKGIQPGQGPRTLDDLMPSNECMKNTRAQIQTKTKQNNFYRGGIP